MRIIAFAIICILPQIGLTAAAAPTFALGAVRQATPAAPQEYVVEVDVAADGYSTFSANIVGDTDAMRLIRKWEAVEREQGVDVVITTTETIETPRIITLIAQYQGRERAGRYWLQPVISAPKEGRSDSNGGKSGKASRERSSGKDRVRKIGSETIGSETIGSERSGRKNRAGKNRAGMPVFDRAQGLFDGEREETDRPLRPSPGYLVSGKQPGPG